MATKEDLKEWLLDALQENGESATIVEVCQHIWENHEADLRASGSLFYTWQYDVRWAATALRNAGKLRPAKETAKGVWQLI